MVEIIEKTSIEVWKSIINHVLENGKDYKDDKNVLALSNTLSKYGNKIDDLEDPRDIVSLLSSYFVGIPQLLEFQIELENYINSDSVVAYHPLPTLSQPNLNITEQP